MIRISNVKLPLSYTDDDIRKACAKELRVSEKAVQNAALYRRSIDARPLRHEYRRSFEHQ